MEKGIAGFTAVALVLLPALVSASTPSDARRLIETGPGQRQWMSAEQISAVSLKQHDSGKCAGFFDVTDHQDWQWAKSELMPFFPKVPNQQRVVEPLLREISSRNILATVQKLSSFRNRYYQNATGAQAAQWLHDQYASIGANRRDVSVQLYKHSFAQPSVIATIAGAGPHANERVIIGGHEDSISRNGSGADMDAPGADDDASGSATVLEVFRVLVQSGFRPDRTLDFMAYAGEEAGLLGSQDIARRYQSARASVYGVMQFDMTMYAGTGKQITFMTDYVNKDLTKFTEMLIDTYVKIPWSEDRCGYGCSDHASWTKAGYASVIPFESKFDDYNPKIHSAGDGMNLLDADFGASFGRLGLAFMIEMASGT